MCFIYKALVVSTKMEQSDVHESVKYVTDFTYKSKIHIPTLVFIIGLHLAGCYGFYLIFYSRLATFIYAAWLTFVVGLGVGVGAHRFYSHKSFKTKSTGVRLALVLLHTLSGQLSLYNWVRDHRLHHKYAETDADPNNPKRGFIYAHIGWLVCCRHPLASSKGKNIDMTDLKMDKIVMFQKKYYFFIYIPLIAITVALPIYLWNETFTNALFICVFARTIYTLTVVFFINSWAHTFGRKPIDNTMPGMDSPLLSFVTTGEGSHNYHHCFPWDYRGGESGSDPMSKFIELLAWMELAYNLKYATDEMIKSRVTKKGDGSHELFGNEESGEEAAEAS